MFIYTFMYVYVFSFLSYSPKMYELGDVVDYLLRSMRSLIKVGRYETNLPYQ